MLLFSSDSLQSSSTSCSLISFNSDFPLNHQDSNLKMDSSDFPVTRSPRKELQGPRPPALKVRKDSHKIKKPPVVPQQQQSQHQQQQQPHHHHHYQNQPRPPVIIYTVSPKVIHTNPSDFMNLVQRLTGSSSSSTSVSSNSNPNPFNDDGGAISPAARFATMEKAKSPKENNIKQGMINSGDMGFLEGIEMGQVMDKSMLSGSSSGNLFPPGILSPGPNSLPPIPPNFFSPQSDLNMVSFFHDLSPVLHGNRNFIEGSFMPSPSTFVSPHLTSPTPSIDLFNNFNFNSNFFDF